MSNLIVGTLVYNEANKFLRRYLEGITKITNNLVIIDDGSTDGSLEICKQYTNNILQTDHLYQQNESSSKQLLWQECTKLCKDGDFILIQDSDELYPESSLQYFQQAIQVANKLQADGISVKLYDMWSETQYREEPPYWVANLHYWTRCVRYKENYTYYWSNRKVHSESVPLNSYFCSIPTKLQIKHMAYSTLELRQKKVEFYNKLDPQAQYGIKGQYDSILDENPILKDFKDNFEELHE